MSRNSYTSSFTLIELLIVIGILAILTAAVVIVLNPTELLKQGRDSTRMTDMASMSKTIQLLLTQNPQVSLGTASTVYISLPDTSSTCTNLSLPTLPAGYTYKCVPTASSTFVNGTGWIPIDFTASGIQNLSKLPLDPVQASSSNLYYIYTPSSNNFVIAASTESKKYMVNSGTDGGVDPGRIEKGSDVLLWNNIYKINQYWSFENNNIGILSSSGVTFSQGVVGLGIDVDSTDILDTINSVSVLNTSQNTVTMWVKPNWNGNDNIPRTFWRVDDDGYGCSKFALLKDVANNLKYGFNQGCSNTQTATYSISNWTQNSWYFITTTFSQGGISGLYINGNLVASITNSNMGSSPVMDWFTLGSWKPAGWDVAYGDDLWMTQADYTNNNLTFSGTLDDVRIYNRVLSSAEIESIYNATK